ncbi:MAG: hypothetical protein QG622_2185 [Actinomycetota bacterium]|nr:hypothetical protein [Actinomycetota bacterium]
MTLTLGDSADTEGNLTLAPALAVLLPRARARDTTVTVTKARPPVRADATGSLARATRTTSAVKPSGVPVPGAMPRSGSFAGSAARARYAPTLSRTDRSVRVTVLSPVGSVAPAPA